jgi:hypothetical protein
VRLLFLFEEERAFLPKSYNPRLIREFNSLFFVGAVGLDLAHDAAHAFNAKLLANAFGIQFAIHHRLAFVRARLTLVGDSFLLMRRLSSPSWSCTIERKSLQEPNRITAFFRLVKTGRSIHGYRRKVGALRGDL